MSVGVKERLLAIIQAYHLKINDFESRCGMSNGYVKNIRKGIGVEKLESVLRAFPAINREWLLYGHGDMLRSGNTATASHSPNAIVNAGDHVSIVGHTTQNSYGDSPEKERKWRPVVPHNVASLPETDIVDYISERETEGQRMERLYSGQAPVDLWLQMNDRSLEPYIMQGDYLGLKAYPKGVCNIFQGDIYAIDTRYDGLKVRVIKNGGTDGTLMACSYNKAVYPDQEISKADIIRVYKKVLMFRY